jgi:hypothetical protein
MGAKLPSEQHICLRLDEQPAVKVQWFDAGHHDPLCFQRVLLARTVRPGPLNTWVKRLAGTVIRIIR